MAIHKLTLPLAALSLAATLAACSGDDEEPSAEKTPSASDPASVDPSNVSPDDMPAIPKVQGAQGA